MALLDVNEVFLDPQLMDTITVTRLAVFVGQDGVQRDGMIEVYEITASVQPASGEVLQTLPEAERVNGALQVFTPFALMAASAGGPGDEFQWNGNTYRIVSLDPLFNYGAGFCSALATRKELVSHAEY